MLRPTRGPAREWLTADEPAERTRLERLYTSGALIVDDRRRRPYYFDGRFLTARDLNREQEYFLTRQSDLGRARGAGVVTGLAVTLQDRQASELVISAGHGITLSGETVILPQTITVRLTDIPEMERLNTAVGLARVPNSPARTRSGAFIVALRPVEFTANPIASYPTSITGPRSVEDGDIVEAVAVTLIPYPGDVADSSPDRQRARIARDIFLTGLPRGIPTGALPLAMIGVQGNTIEWVDPFLVRREVGADHGDVLGLGFAPRAMREAFLVQYDHHLSDVLRQRAAHNLSPRFSASDYFMALPPAGRMPVAAVDPRGFTQVYFPPEVDVDLSFVAEDELIPLLEESLLLPPLDLTLNGDELESTSVLILLPVKREQLRVLKTQLQTLTRPLRPAALGLLARRKPLQILTGLRAARGEAILPASDDLRERLVAEPWGQQLNAALELWYVRRRNLAYKAEVVGAAVPVVAPPGEQPGPGPAPHGSRDLAELLDRAGLVDEYRAASDCLGADRMAALDARLLAAFERDPDGALAASILRRVTVQCADSGGNFDVGPLIDRFADANLGGGLRLLRLSDDQLTTLARLDLAPDLDLALQRVSGNKRTALVKKIRAATNPDDFAAVVRKAVETP